MQQDSGQTDVSRRYGQVVVKAWADEAFRRRLLANPTAVLREHGIELPTGVEARVVEDTERVRHFVLPARAEEELTLEELDLAAGGYAGRNANLTQDWP